MNEPGFFHGLFLQGYLQASVYSFLLKFLQRLHVTTNTKVIKRQLDITAIYDRKSEQQSIGGTLPRFTSCVHTMNTTKRAEQCRHIFSPQKSSTIFWLRYQPSLRHRGNWIFPLISGRFFRFHSILKCCAPQTAMDRNIRRPPQEVVEVTAAAAATVVAQKCIRFKSNFAFRYGTGNFWIVRNGMWCAGKAGPG